MTEFWFCFSLLCFVVGFYLGLVRGTEKTIRIIDMIIKDRRGEPNVVDIKTRKVIKK